MPLSGNIEDNVLTAICWHERLAPEVAAKVEFSDFSTEPYRRIARAALDFLQRHGKPAGVHLRRRPRGRNQTRRRGPLPAGNHGRDGATPST